MALGKTKNTYAVFKCPTNGGLPLWWWVGPACRDRNDHLPPRSSYVSDTMLFSHE